MERVAKVTYINPPKACDVCDAPFNGEAINDVYVPSYHRWGCVCDNCAKTHYVGYGTGQGQRFECQDGVYVKTKG